MKSELEEVIKSRGYWRVHFRPLGPPRNLSLKECRGIIEKSVVKLRGWYFPFYHEGRQNHYATENHNDYLAAWIDAGEQKEFWRLYRSGQFIHYAAVDEDWMDGSQERQFNDKKIEPGKYLNFVGSLTYYITEIVEFLTRLNKAGLYTDGVSLSISLHNTEGRELTSFEFGRMMSFPKVTAESTIRFEKRYTNEDLSESAKELAIEPILHFFEMFDFPDVSVEQVVKVDQQTLYGYHKH